MQQTGPEHGTKKRTFSRKHRILAITAAVLLVIASSAFVFLDWGGANAGQVAETGQASLVAGSNQGAPSDGAADTLLNKATTTTATTQTTTAETEPTTEATTASPNTKTTTAAPAETTAQPVVTPTPVPTPKPTQAPTPVTLSGTGKVNILLIGSDARLGLDGARSDSMIMLTFDRDTKQIKLLSFMRDMYVAIPGHGSTKINAAFNYGGEPLLTETLRNNFDVALETYITIRFENFIAVVDQIGGIDLYLTQPEIDYINAEIGGIPDGEGVKHLTGAQTLSHTRNRRVGNGDFTRTARQRATIKAIFSQIKNQGDAATLAGLVGYAIGNVKTNISADQLLSLATEVISAGDVSFADARVPFDGTWEYATKSGASVIAVDFAANQEKIRTFIDG
ncbi:MAG: LCP family protein [Eubacteriales bacterium]|nr:LCP family protein [Eubacteriales bacterium]